jgi:long-chain acyl-CoA synthetase
MKRTVISMLHQAAKNRPNFVYLAEKGNIGWNEFSFSKADEESDFLAAALLNLDIKFGDNLAIVSEGRVGWVIGEFALLKVRASAVPLSVKLLPEEILFRLNHSQSKAIFVSRNNFEKVAQIYERIEAPDFKLIYFDADKDWVKSACDKHKLNADSVIFYDDLLANGRKLHEKVKEKLSLLENEIQEDDVVTISYTSGTTGNPKGIMLTHLNYYSNSQDANEFFKMKAGMKTLIILPLDHSFAHTVGIYISLLVPISMYFLDARGGAMHALKNIPINLKEVKPSFLLTVPALSGNFMNKMIEGVNAKGGFIAWLFNKGLSNGMIINGDGYKKAPFLIQAWKAFPYLLAKALIFPKLRDIFGGEMQFAVGGGALLDIKQQKFFYTIGIPIYQGYGLTEATPIISANAPHIHKLGTSGWLMPNQDVKIMDDGKVLSQGQKGEIVLRGLNVMKGYYKNEKATAETIKDGALYTGDMAYFDKDGFFVVTGRAKALLISQNGEKYSPEEIEEAIINTSPFVFQAMLYNDHSPFTTAVITLDEAYTKSFVSKNGIKSSEELLSQIEKSVNAFKQEKDYKAKFPEIWTPSAFVIADEIFTEDNKMVNSTMKMVRYKVTEMYLDNLNEIYQKSLKNNSAHNLKVLAKYF